MVNNSVFIIGVAITNLEKNPRSNTIYNIDVELSQIFSKSGESFVVPVTCYLTNKAIDFDAQYLGKQVAIQGYINYHEKLAVPLHIVAQNIIDLSKPIQDQIKDKKEKASLESAVGTSKVTEW